MDKYYFIFTPFSLSGDNYRKYTYTQYLKAAETSRGGNYWKVLKADFNALEKSLKGVYLNNKTKYIFNRLSIAGKVSHV